MAYKVSKWEAILGGDLYRLRNFLRRVISLIIGLIPVRGWRNRVRSKVDNYIIHVNKDKIDYFLKNYPSVYSENETISKIIATKASIARFGDGEFNLCIGRSIGFQKQDDFLVSRLKEILLSAPSSERDCRLLVGINSVYTIDDLDKTWMKFIVRRGNRVLRLFRGMHHHFESSTITGSFPRDKASFEARKNNLKEIWEGRKVLFVVGDGGRFFLEKELFDNIPEHDYLYASAKNAAVEYYNILSAIKEYGKGWLVLVSLGPTATVLAYDLARLGYQAIDFGQVPGNYRRAKYGCRYPEGHPLRKATDFEYDALMG